MYFRLEWLDTFGHMSFNRAWEKRLGGGFKYVLFILILGEMIQFDEPIFQMGGKKLPTRPCLGKKVKFD